MGLGYYATSNSADLKVERQRLTIAVKSIKQRYDQGLIDLDDIIEELRPIRMRMHYITCQLKDNSETIDLRMEAKMNTDDFRKYLSEKEISENEITSSIAFVERFTAYLDAAGRTTMTKEDVTDFSTIMINDGTNTLPNYYALARYGRFIKNDDVYIAVIDLLDGGEAMGNLYQKVGEVLGEEKRDVVFEGIDLPSMGTPNQEKVAVNQHVMTRLEVVADPNEKDQIFSHSLRDLEDAWFQDEKNLFEECQDIDDFLDKSAQNFISQLEKLRDDSELFFTQEITDEVVKYVRDEPLIARGLREENIIYEVKIPHQTREFLAETDEQKKRYYYCHCPWVKESLKNGASDIPDRFCDCSAGFHKKRWEVIFEQPLKAKIVESVLKGDDWCKIEIRVPEGVN